MLTILLTDASTPATRGTIYMLRNNPDREKVRIIGVDASPTPAAHWFDQFYIDSPDEEFDLVFPQTDHSALIWADDPRAVISPKPTLERALNKGSLLAYFKELNLPTPAFQTISKQEDLFQVAQSLGYPEKKLIVKPAQSCGSRGICLLNEVPDPIAFFRERPLIREMPLADFCKLAQSHPNLPELLLMEYLPGSEYSVDAFVGEGDEVAICRKRLKIVGGLAAQTELISHPDLTRNTLQAGRSLGLRYIFGMQFKCNADGEPMILECNPRIQGTSIASFFGGPNLIWLSLCEKLGRPKKIPPVQYASFARCWGGVASTSSQSFQL